MTSFPGEYEKLFNFLAATSELGHESFHGPDHWLRVLLNGQMLAAAEGANSKVVELFALLHDSRRLNEDSDPFHGYRAGMYARTLRGSWFEISDHEMLLLEQACVLHSEGITDADITIRCCWDADRLDLGRVGIVPNAKYLCTQTGRKAETIAAAHAQSRTAAVYQIRDIF